MTLGNFDSFRVGELDGENDEIREAIGELSVSLTSDGASQIDFAVHDPGFAMHNNGYFVIRDAETLEETLRMSTPQRRFLGIDVPRRRAVLFEQDRPHSPRYVSLLSFDGAQSQRQRDPRSDVHDPLAIDPLGRGYAMGFHHNRPGLIWTPFE